MFISGIRGRNTRQITNFRQPVSNLLLYQKWILNIGMEIYINLPAFMKRTYDNGKEFKPRLRSFLYSNPFYTLDK